MLAKENCSVNAGAIYSQHPGIPPEEMRKEIFLRFYGLEFSQADREKIFLTFAAI